MNLPSDEKFKLWVDRLEKSHLTAENVRRFDNQNCKIILININSKQMA